MRRLPCRGRGVTIYPFGGDRLAVEVDGRPGLVKKLAAIPGVELWQDGDGEKTFRFDVANFRWVAEVVRPHRRRRLSPEGRAELARRPLAANASRRQALPAR
jgi:hypothetical protein